MSEMRDCLLQDVLEDRVATPWAFHVPERGSRGLPMRFRLLHEKEQTSPGQARGIPALVQLKSCNRVFHLDWGPSRLGPSLRRLTTPRPHAWMTIRSAVSLHARHVLGEKRRFPPPRPSAVDSGGGDGGSGGGACCWRRCHCFNGSVIEPGLFQAC